jgi:Na+/H+-dicarboxylate symporter
LALILFSILVGFAVLTASEKGKKILPFLEAGEEIFMRVFSFIMYYAPIGFFAYFAVLVSQLGPDILKNYAQVAAFYYIFSIAYFIIVYTLYAYLAQKTKGIVLFWQHIFLPMITAFATCSSAASLPANLLAAKRMKVPAEISETVVPLGTMIHKEGSIIGGMVKIVFLFSVFHLPFSSLPIFLTAIAISMLVGTVMGAIPSGGMLGELLILSMYGFPSSALGMIAAISIIIDPLATMLNVTGNTVSSMLVGRFLGKQDP